MLHTLISSKTRIKLLVRLFLNPNSEAHLRRLAEEFSESTNAVRQELNRFLQAGLIVSENQGNKKIFRANRSHPLFMDINSILIKYVGLDRIIDTVVGNIGSVEAVYLTGDYAIGRDSGIVDLIFIGEVNKNFLVSLVGKTETAIAKKIRYLIYNTNEWVSNSQSELRTDVRLLLWQHPESNLIYDDNQ